MGTDTPAESDEHPTTENDAEVVAVTDPFQDQQNRALALSLAVNGNATPGADTVAAATLYHEFLSA